MKVIGIDVGGTKIAAATVDEDGNVGPVQRIATPSSEGSEAMLSAFAVAARQAAEADNVEISSIPAIGVGTAGVVDTNTGTILDSTNVIVGWQGTNVSKGLQDQFDHDVDVFVQNDVDAHAMGELWKGSAAKYESVLMVAPGTGVGACLIINGEPVRGAHHVGGEIGHMPVGGFDDMPCSCKKFGHVESIACGPAIYRWYLGHGGDTNCRDTIEIVERANKGEAVAIKSLQVGGAALGLAMAGLVTVIDPEIVLLSGGLAQAGDIWWDAMESSFRGTLIPTLQDVPIVLGELGGVAPILGAASMAFDKSSNK